MTEAAALRATRRRFPGLRMSFEEYLTLDRKFNGDWVDGQVYDLGSESRRHQEVAGFLMVLIQLWAERNGRGEILPRFVVRPRPDLPAREVDILFVAAESRGRIRGNYFDGPADLIIQVVSDESRELDRGDRFSEFEHGGVREYWLIDPELERAEVFRMGADGRFEPVPLGDPPVVRSGVVPGLWFKAEWLWAEPIPDMWDVMKEWGLV